MKFWYILNSKRVLTENILIFLVLLLAACHQKSQDKFRVGEINGVHLRIPEEYLLYGVVYKNFPKKNTDNTEEIDNFAIALSASDLHLLSRDTDSQLWLEARDSPYRERSIVVNFNDRQPLTAVPSLSAAVDNEKGPFITEKNKYGLEAYLSIQSPEYGDKKGQWGRMEYLYHAPDHTIIECETHKMVVSPFSEFTYCQQRVFIPQANLMVKAYYRIGDLKKWSEINKVIQNLFSSYSNGGRS